jgi:hypothetical protein
VIDMRSSTVISAFVSAVALASCSSADSSAGARASTWDVPECEEPHGEIHRPTSTFDAQGRLEGAWFSCGEPIAFAQVVHSTDAAGLVIENGNFTLLRREGDRLVRSGPSHSLQAFDDGGAPHRRFTNVTFGHDPDHPYRFRVAPDGKFLVVQQPVFNPFANGRATFVRAAVHGAPPPRRIVDDDDAQASDPADVGVPVPAAANGPCAPIEEALFLDSADLLESRIAGTWRVCSGDLGGPPGARGLELIGAQGFALVEKDGMLVRGPTWSYEFDVRLALGDPSDEFFIDLIDVEALDELVMRVSRNVDAIELTRNPDRSEVVRLERAR